MASEWEISQRCGDGACMQVRQTDDDMIEVGDTKDPDGPTLKFTRDEWLRTLNRVRNGDYDLSYLLAARAERTRLGTLGVEVSR